MALNILIVEDQEEKSSKIAGLLENDYDQEVRTCIRKSLRSGLREVITNRNYDLVLLDMSMPSFDPTEDDPSGGTPESFAGKEFLAQIYLRGIYIPTLVITQYYIFRENEISLKEIDDSLRKLYPDVYMGSIYYSSASNEWRNMLLEFVKEKF